MKLLVMILVALMLSCLGAAKTSAGERASNTNTAWASWYGPGLYGNYMGCGGRLTTKTWGVANKTLRCGTSLTICYHRCVKVTVVDRGPFVRGREFDLTYPVLRAVGGYAGVIKVRWWINR